jgi:hypothetical protein
MEIPDEARETLVCLSFLVAASTLLAATGSNVGNLFLGETL